MSDATASGFTVIPELTDTMRLQWLMDVVMLGDDAKADAKAIRLAGALMMGKKGRDALDAAIAAAPDPLIPTNVVID